MTALQPFLIAGSDQGLVKDKKSFLLPDKAFPTLTNAYVWRDRVVKRQGLKILGRLRRVLTSQAQANADGTGDYDIADILTSFRANEPNAELESGSLILTLDDGGANETQFTDQGDGTLLRTAGTAYDIDPGTYINYISGAIHIEWDAAGTPGAGITVDADFAYFPSLPVMGIMNRETSDVNNEPTLIFDTIYAYVNDGTKYSEYLGAAGATWNGTNFEFFWGTNFSASDASVRNLFVTNFNNDALSPMRYTDGSTWTDFSPAIEGTRVTSEVLGTLTTPWNSFGPVFTANTPIIEGTVTINVTNGVDPDVIFTDEARDGTLKGFASTNSGTINYTTGEINLTISPAMTADATVTMDYQYETSYLWTARILIPYYGRLLALNTYESLVQGSAKNFFNRCRFSQVGNPTQSDAWISTVFGKGGFIDAPTDEEIISARFYKNTLIVFFERSTWQLRYVGEYGLPFVWDRISSDFGCESQFSSILFDDAVLAIGDRAIIGATTGNVQRIDEKIPDTVFTFKNSSNSETRVQGIRDFYRELVYWSFIDIGDAPSGSSFPNKSLVYNYKNNTFSIFRNNITAFGTFYIITGVTWDSTDAFWEDETIFWDDLDSQTEFPSVICGNQEGFIHEFSGTSLDDYSLSVTDIDRTGAILKLEIINHNLIVGDIIYLTGATFIDTSDSSSVSTDLNDQTYRVFQVPDDADGYDPDNIYVEKWNTTDEEYQTDFSYTPASGTGTYIGGGLVALFPKMDILTKDFNPFLQEGKQTKIGYLDILSEQTQTAQVTIELYADTFLGEKGNMLVGQDKMITYRNPTLPSVSDPADLVWNRFFATLFGQFISARITYDDSQMNDTTILNQPFVMPAMIFWMKPGGRISP